MKTNLTKLSACALACTVLCVATAPLAQATPSAPEPTDYALGFGGVTLALVVWRNFRRARQVRRRQ